MKKDVQTVRAQELAARREPFVRATVVRAQHPTSARAGDVALVLASGEIEGFVGGNCVEASVREYSLRALTTHEPLLLKVVPGEPSRVHEEGSVEVANPCLSGGAIEVFLEPEIPAPHVIVVGSTPVAQALAELGERLGFEMELTDGSLVSPSPDDAAVIVASHGKEEEPALERALRAEVPYVALVASEKRGTAVLASLEVDQEQRARVFTPAGLEIGATAPAEIALAILAQLVAERSKSAVAEPVLSMAVDPVCGMAVAAVDASLRVDLDGTRYYFCSEGCRSAFLTDSERYAVAH
ncbi:XdhC family protein [Leifsonia sp. McL0607]|uniref:XdhC family protein n=1 Tax=Leifsonia sp. McL0607 TaxID=3415672 RepID=UPI003CFA9085